MASPARHTWLHITSGKHREPSAAQATVSQQGMRCRVAASQRQQHDGHEAAHVNIRSFNLLHTQRAVSIGVTCLRKTRHSKLEFSRNGLKSRERSDEEESVHGRADHRDLEQHEPGVKTADLCREHGISAATFYQWKQKFGGMAVSEARRLRALEDENRRWKLLVAELSLGGEAFKAVIRKNGWSSLPWGGDVAQVSAEFRLSDAGPASCWAWSGRATGMSRGRIATRNYAENW